MWSRFTTKVAVRWLEAATETRAHRFQRPRGVVIQLEISGLLWIARPEVDVWFVRDLEVPLSHLIETIAIDEMLRKSADEAVPFLVVLRRSDDRLVPEGMHILAQRELLRHEAEFDKRPHAVLQQTVIDLIDVGKIVDRIS